MNLIYLNQYERKDPLSCPDKEEIFNAKFKSDLVIELLGVRKISIPLQLKITSNQNLLRNWKKEF